jgi:FHA domain
VGALGRAFTLGALEVLDRDGQPRHTVLVHGWPLRIGRALDNDVVLSDPHVAAHHASIAHGEHGLELHVGTSRNGVQLGHRLLRADDRAALPAGGAGPIEFSAGRTRLRLRLPDQALADEVPLAATASLARQTTTIAIAALVVLIGLLFRTWLDTDPDGFGRAAGTVVLGAVVATAVWCGAWALLSKTFAHQARFGWHLRVFLLASIGTLAVTVLPPLAAFTLSFPWIADFAFVAAIGVGATGLYYHLLAVEPARHRLMKAVAITGAAVGIALTLWFNLQRGDRWGDELYMSHLFPPALRLARPVAPDAFVGGLAPLKAVLDRKAREPSRGDESGPEGDE